MMKSVNIAINQTFIGRESEQKRLEKIMNDDYASIVIMYGRRRVGKTEILEQTFKDRNVLKFEGIEGASEHAQMKSVMSDLASYAGEPLLKEVSVKTWKDVFDYIAKYTSTGKWTIYFEEVQWLAQYRDEFVSYLKHAWDNKFKRNDNNIVILCGSAPSFMVNQVAHSKALYNRSTHELHLKPFSIHETRQLLSRYSLRDVMDTYLTVGGIPLYLNYLKSNSSAFLSLCENTFMSDAFFSREYEKIFISSMSEKPHYRKIIEILSQRKFATRKEILKALKLSSGGNITEILRELELCNFIECYVPFHLKSNSLLARYCISDPYLQFYNKFIRPIQDEIQSGRYNDSPTSAIKYDSYMKWLGFAFERYCRQKHFDIAKILGFPAVNYKSGAFYQRSTEKEDPNYQIDLVFERDDNVITICEMKYTKNPVSSKVISEFERKCEWFPNQKNKTIHKVLISAAGADDSVKSQGYFDNIITIEDLFKR